MKKFILIGWVLLTTPMVIWAASMTFVVSDLKSNQGSVRVGIYGNKTTFLKKGKAMAGYSNKDRLANKQARVICQLKPGKYAVAVFHDENDNGDLDTNFLGLPREGYGFSNNAASMMGPPKFKDAAFTMGAEDLEMTIRMNY